MVLLVASTIFQVKPSFVALKLGFSFLSAFGSIYSSNAVAIRFFSSELKTSLLLSSFIKVNG
jgi:hypothetical protein